jgi:hypothetical protein
MVMGKNKRRWGYELFLTEDLVDIQVVKPSAKTPEAKWRDGWNKVLSKLEKSGLWQDIAANIRTVFEVGFEKVTEAYRIYWLNYPGDWIESEKARTQAIFDIDSRLTYTNDKGELHVNTEIVWYLSKQPKIKKMYFGKYYTEDILAGIAKAMAEKREHHVARTAGYDVSFEYKPEANKAWYSEEYRGCGNGHYYLALDATHALFYEDD